MVHHDLLARLRDITATTEALDSLLQQTGATLASERADEAALAAMRLSAGLHAAREVLIPSVRAMTAMVHQQRGPDRKRIEDSKAAVARSRALLEKWTDGKQPAPNSAADEARPDPSLLARFIAKLEHRDRLSAGEREALTNVAGRSRRLPAGEDIVREGSRPGECTVLLDGFAAYHKMLREGGRQITEIRVPGDVVDLDGFLLSPVPYAATALPRARWLRSRTRRCAI